MGSVLDSSFRQAGPAVLLCLATLLPTLGLGARGQAGGCQEKWGCLLARPGDLRLLCE